MTAATARPGLVTQVIDQAHAGRTAHRIAADLGVAVGTVEAALEHARRLGLVVTAGHAVGGRCDTCPPSGTATPRPLGCAGCFFAR